MMFLVALGALVGFLMSFYAFICASLEQPKNVDHQRDITHVITASFILSIAFGLALGCTFEHLLP